jgi:hypothetical protein
MPDSPSSRASAVYQLRVVLRGLSIFAGDGGNFGRTERLRLTQRITHVGGLEYPLCLESNPKTQSRRTCPNGR